MCSASASGELNVKSESQGSLYPSQAASGYLRFSATASACADWFSAWVMHESMLRLKLYMTKLCAEVMCSTHVFIMMPHLPFYNFKKGCILWVNENLTHY